MAAEITQITTQDFLSQTYNNNETNLISSTEINSSLSENSYIELFVYDFNKNILTSEYNFTQYTVLNNPFNNGVLSQIEFDPETILLDRGFTQGGYITYFNFLNKNIGSPIENLYISEISSDRTEVRLDSTILSNLDIIEQTKKFIQERDNSSYFLDFYLNFGDNKLLISNNIELDISDQNNPTILVKLYESLPEDFDLNSPLWITSLVEEPTAYQVVFEEEPIVINDFTNISGPNFNIDLKDKVNNSTQNLSYSDLIATSLTSSIQQLNSLLEEKEIDINIDYSDFSNFIHFSSAQTRLQNFYYKVQLIEQYSSSIAILNNTINANPSESITLYQSNIDNIITNFDGYEYYLYYENTPYSWPKTNSQKPYVLEPSNSTTVLSWLGSLNESSPYYGGFLLSASTYDNSNKDNLLYTIPEYLRDDPANSPYELFVQMVAQHYDNIWIYYKEVTQKYNADNRLEYGVSKDIVADAIRDFGIKLYQNNFSTQDLYTAFLGITPEGGLFPFPNITGSLPTPTGYEYVDTLISASNDYIPLDDVNKSLYKRIYHNLPYLLKSKGTIPGLRTLITSYGIPDTILRINEFGGKDKINSNDWDYWQSEFNYVFNNEGSNFLISPFELNPDWNAVNNRPSTIEFRFKPTEFPPSNLSQSIFTIDGSYELTLQYTGSGLTSGSYSGSIVDPYYQYANLILYPDTSNLTLTASIYAPVFDGDWWNVILTSGSTGFEIVVGSKTQFPGESTSDITLYSSSIQSPNDYWSVGGASYFLIGSLYSIPSSSLQEIRYYTEVLNKNTFINHIVNPSSIESNTINNSPNVLAFRAPLGNELYTESISIHPKVTGLWNPTQSFGSDSNFYFDSTPTFIPNTEYFFYNQPVVGIKNIVSDKVRVENNVLPEGDTLSPFRVLSQNTDISQSYTPSTNYLEVAFSPQNEINEDIIDQIGFFNIGEYIGDPRLRSSSAESYPDLDQLRNDYFQKYTSNYNLTDFIRLIKFFDNSLFKMIRDFVPARTSLASGIIIKQHLLERNKYPQPQMEWEDLDISGTLKPTWNGYQEGTVEHFEGGTGGSFSQFNLLSNTSQSWYENIHTPSGSTLVLHNSQDEFYNGEFSGSALLVSDGILNIPYPVNNQSFNYKQVYYYGTGSNEGGIFENLFINNNTSPQDGEILFFERYFGTGIGFIVGSPKYLKISKIDSTGINHSTPLGQLDTILIQTSVSGSNIWIKYDVTILNEQSNYYSYQVINSKYLNQDISYASSWYPNQVFDYKVSSSITSSQALSYFFGIGTPENFKINPWDNILPGTNLAHYGTPYFNTSSGNFTLENTPNTPLSITASVITSGSSTGVFGIYVNQQGNIITLATKSYNAGSNVTSTLSASYYGLQNDKLFLALYKDQLLNSSYLKSGSLLITQSRAISSSNSESTIFEPYITTVDFYNSDENALLNNVFDLRDSSKFMEVDYTPDITTPVNFSDLISGSAIKAKVQDSNYTTQRHIIPRYLGSKSTSQQLNVWSQGDTGTYGKLPTVENLKTAVAYGDMSGGWPPERMNASSFRVMYLITEDGNVIIPDTSENSLFAVQGNFQSGERFRISSPNKGNGDTIPYRTVIRGGSRIEPILYTQSGSAPNAQWNTTMSFEDIIPSDQGAVGNYTALFKRTSNSNIFYGNGSINSLPFQNSIYGGSYLSGGGYVIPTGAITDGISLTFNINLNIVYYPIDTGGTNPSTFITTLFLYKNSTLISQIDNPPMAYYYGDNGNISLSYSIPTSQLNAGDIYSIKIRSISDYPSWEYFQVTSGGDTQFRISQYPLYTQPVTSSGTNSIWGFLDKTNYPYVITSSNPTLVELYDVGVKQVDITGSGFNPISLPFSIKYGDEFRFEGREDFTYQVGKVFPSQYSGSDRISQTGSIEVHFNSNLPVSASSSAFNLDHFLIRRYVDDSSQILFEGFKPVNSTGPYILTPEYVTPSLNKNIDDFVTILTEKGLL